MALTTDAYLQTLGTAERDMIDALREIIRGAHGDLAERIKWNAPSFVLDGEDRVTLGLDRKGGVRLVLHRGAKAKHDSGFVFDDPAGLAAWPAADRGVVQFRDLADIEAKAAGLKALCERWLRTTS